MRQSSPSTGTCRASVGDRGAEAQSAIVRRLSSGDSLIHGRPSTDSSARRSRSSATSVASTTPCPSERSAKKRIGAAALGQLGLGVGRCGAKRRSTSIERGDDLSSYDGLSPLDEHLEDLAPGIGRTIRLFVGDARPRRAGCGRQARRGLPHLPSRPWARACSSL
jgi:hypothetical protein